MNMNIKTIAALNLALLGLAPATFAQGSQTGGGRSISKSGQVVIRELVDPSFCKERTTRTLLEEYQLSDKLDQFLDSIARVNPYLSLQYKKEIFSLSWCETTGLNKTAAVDQKQFASYFIADQQLAIRDIDGKRVYLEEKAFKAESPLHQIMTLLHETSHSFLDKNLENRDDKIGNLNKALFLTYQDLEKNKRSLESVTGDLDSAVLRNKADQILQTSEFGKAFDHYVKYEDEASAVQMAKLNPDSKGYLNLLIDTLGRPSILSRAPFVNEIRTEAKTANKVRGPYADEDKPIVDAKYHFQFPLVAYHTPTALRGYEGLGQNVYYGALNQNQDFSFGGCDVQWRNEKSRLSFLFSDRKSGRIERLIWSYQPKSANSLNLDQLAADVSYNTPIIAQDMRNYRQQLSRFIQILGSGFCSDPSAKGLMKFYPKF